ncbi:phospholipase domain-containing protein, partial [Streptomyces broussonetiae]|uniref:phospholipase domain-containing protein n=1 Tax=Streptomyces broussonetiae TaxID=2686304 RepID=UPI0035D93A9A
GKLTLTFASGAHAGAAFLVTSGNRTDGPWTYTTGAGKTLSDTWNSFWSGGTHDLAVHGPNGFLRVFKGRGKVAGPEVTARPAGDHLELAFTNKGSGAVQLKVVNGYGGHPATVTVRPGATVQHTVDLTASKRWYDVTVTCDADPAFLRGFAGHVENGRPGVSDPAIVTQ